MKISKGGRITIIAVQNNDNYLITSICRHFIQQFGGKIEARALEKRRCRTMAKGRRKRKAPSQAGAHSADELNNPSHNEDIVLLSQPCSTATGVPSPAGKYIPKFSSKKPKLSKGTEEHEKTPPKRIPCFSPQKTVGREVCPSELEAGTEVAVIDQLAPQQAGIEVQEEKESKQHAVEDRTLDVALTKVCQECTFTEGTVMQR